MANMEEQLIKTIKGEIKTHNVKIKTDILEEVARDLENIVFDESFKRYKDNDEKRSAFFECADFISDYLIQMRMDL